MNASIVGVILFFLCFLISCSSDEEQKSASTPDGEQKSEDADQSSQAEDYLPMHPYFKVYVDPFGKIVPEEFCNMYLSADAFIFGSIVSVEMTEEPFVARDPITGERNADIVVESLDQCAGVSPALKIDIEVENFFSGYEFEQPRIISLYIGRERAWYMKPEPVPDFTIGPRLNSSVVTWKNEGCESGQPCALIAGQQLGFFANIYVDDGRNEIWYLSEYFFWSSSASYPQDEGESPRYLNIKNKSNLTDIKNGIDTCNDWVSETVTARRNEDHRKRLAVKSLADCTMK